MYDFSECEQCHRDDVKVTVFKRRVMCLDCITNECELGVSLQQKSTDKSPEKVPYRRTTS